VGGELQHMSWAEYYRRETEILFRMELLLHRWGLSEFVFDDKEQVFRDRDGMIVLGHHYANRGKILGADSHAT
jgi:hypothetical protein